MAALLDVNVLIALLEPNHIHHDIAHDWFGDQRQGNWASCPLTQNGFIRIISQRNYGYPMTTASAAAALAAFIAETDHEFWPDSISLLDLSHCDATRLASAGQLTDTYLLALAKANGGQLVTLDARLIVNAVADGKDSLTLLR